MHRVKNDGCPMTPATLNTLALGLGILGFACFAWPIMQRVSGKAKPEQPGSGKSLRSPLWWAGFVLTIAAIFLQRIASQQAGGG
jgi:hypothetical protein